MARWRTDNPPRGGASCGAVNHSPCAQPPADLGVDIARVPGMARRPPPRGVRSPSPRKGRAPLAGGRYRRDPRRGTAPQRQASAVPRASNTSSRVIRRMTCGRRTPSCSSPGGSTECERSSPGRPPWCGSLGQAVLNGSAGLSKGLAYLTRIRAGRGRAPPPGSFDITMLAADFGSSSLNGAGRTRPPSCAPARRIC